MAKKNAAGSGTIRMKAIKGDRFEDLFLITLFTGLRQGEVLGLTWECIDYNRGIITINKQMQLHQEEGMEAFIKSVSGE